MNQDFVYQLMAGCVGINVIYFMPSQYQNHAQQQMKLTTRVISYPVTTRASHLLSRAMFVYHCLLTRPMARHRFGWTCSLHDAKIATSRSKVAWCLWYRTVLFFIYIFYSFRWYRPYVSPPSASSSSSCFSFSSFSSFLLSPPLSSQVFSSFQRICLSLRKTEVIQWIVSFTWEKERKRKKDRGKEKKRERVCVCVSVWERVGKEGKHEKAGRGERESEIER